MKRYLIVLFLILATSAAAAQPDTLAVWSRYDLANENDPNAANLARFIDAYERDTGVTVAYEQVAWDQLPVKLAVAAQSGADMPDVVAMGSQHITSLLDVGALQPLDDLLAGEAWVNDLTRGDTEACLIDGVRYCVMAHVRGGITYYRADLFPDGFPQTTADWLATAPALSEGDNVFTSAYAGRSFAAIETFWFPMIASNSGRVFDDEGKPAWASDEVVEVVEFGRGLFREGYMPQITITGDFGDAEAPWLNGEAASFRGASWSAMFVPGLREAVNSGEVLLTGGVDFGSGAHVFLVSDGWVVPAGVQNPDGARLWLRSFMQPDFLATWASTQAGIPTIPAAAESETFDTPFFSAVSEILSAQGVYIAPSPYYIESLSALAVAMQELMLDPDLNAMTRLQQAQDEVLRRYW